MIVAEKKLLIGAEDVQYVRMTCKKCKSVHAVTISGRERLWPRCPSCKAEWFNRDDSPEECLLEQLRSVCQNGSDAATLQLEVKAPEEN